MTVSLIWLAFFSLTQTSDYLNSEVPTETRVADLLSRMTLEEKIGQMTQINVTRLMGTGEWDRGQLNTAWLERALVTYHVGSVLSGGGAAPVPNTPRNWAQLTNALQEYTEDSTRLAIPLIYGVDAVHGHNNVLGATIYPHNIGLAATWNPELAGAISSRVAKDMQAVGTPWTFAPVADIGRDPRWGRFYETFGEDPLLASEMVQASTAGFEGAGVSATVKHFIGYGQPLVGFDRSPAYLDSRSLQTIHLPSFQAGIALNPGAVMANSGTVNGIPVHASYELLTALLRDDLGFEGVLVSDWEDILKLVTVHKTAATFAEAVAQSVNAGVDMYMVPHDFETFTITLRTLVTEGRVSEARIDEAVSRILTLKFRLGLFEERYVDAEVATATVVEAERTLAKQAALESLTLLERGRLPLTEGHVVVLGPSAHSLTNQMGGWTIDWQGMTDPNQLPPGLTILEALETTLPDNMTLRYEARYRQPAAVEAAILEADHVIVVLGEMPYAEEEGDSSTLALPEAQLELLRQAVSSQVPTTLVLVAGRPLVIPDELWRNLDSLVMAYLPGSEGGSALADVIGRANPSGRLPFSWPRHAGQLPLTYDVPPGGPYDSLYPFGYGGSYTSFRYRNTDAELSEGMIRVSLELDNTGDYAGTEIVQVYAERPPAGVLTPERQLVAFSRVTLEPAETLSVMLEFPTATLAVIPGDVFTLASSVIIPGDYTLHVGGQRVRVTLP